MSKDNVFRLALALIIAVGVVSLTLGVVSQSEAAPSQAVVKRERLIINIATGAEGSATGSATSNTIIDGFIVRVDIDYGASLTTTTDLTISGVDDLIAQNFVNLSNTATDQTLYPAVQLTDNAGTGLTYDGTRALSYFYPVNDRVTATLAQSEAMTPAATIDIYFVEDK